MSQENVEIVRRMYEAFHGGDAEGALTHFDPEVEVDADINVDVGTARGREHLSEVIGRWVGAWDDWREEIEEMRDIGDHVLVVSTQHGRSKGSGIEGAMRYAVLYEVHDGMITRMGLYAGPQEALAAAGLEE